jgi:formylmethanofuran dehydrogenase subunit E
MNWIIRWATIRENNQIKRIQVYECKKCGSIFPIDSFTDKPQNITCLTCYLSEGKKIE